MQQGNPRYGVSFSAVNELGTAETTRRGCAPLLTYLVHCEDVKVLSVFLPLGVLRKYEEGFDQLLLPLRAENRIQTDGENYT